MKLARVGLGAIVTSATLLLIPTVALAVSPPAIAAPAGLSIVEIKFTGSEFVMLQNNTGSDINDLSVYRLTNFNNSNPLTATSNTTQQLPAASLAVSQTVLLSGDGGATCGAAVTDSLSISLTDSTGFLEVVQQSLVNGQLIQTAGDAVAWGSGTTQASGMIGTVPSATSAPLAAYYRYQNSASTPPFLWQRADTASVTNTCQLNVTGATPPAPSNPGNQLLPGSPPPAQIVSLTSSTGTIASLPPSDVGLKAPTINELLPNPASPITDTDGEFIELYNSNSASFDLSGFVLQTGTTTTHKYTFPSGVKLKPNSFTAFSLKGTGLSLSNSSGRAELFDPLGNLISKTDDYGTAKDGLSWALADGKWYWTNSPTPSAENVINQSSSGSASSGGSAPQILGASSSQNSGGGSGGNSPNAAATPLHPWTLAGVGALAVGYGLYEYRQDLANRFHQFQRYRTARAAAGSPANGRGSAGVASRLGRWQNNLRARSGGRRGKSG